MMADAGYLAIDLSVAPDNMVQAVFELLNVLAETRDTMLSEEELAAIVKSYIFDLDFSRDQTDSLAVRYGWGGTQAEYLRTLDQDISELKKVTPPEDLQNAARRFLRSDAMKLVVVGPWSEAERHEVEELIKVKTLV